MNMKHLHSKKSIFLILFFLFASWIQAQSIERITFSAAASNNSSFKSNIGSPYGANLSGANGSLTISAEYGESTYKESGLVGINDLENNITVKAFPNPSMSSINIVIESEVKYPITVELFNMTGALIQEYLMESNVIELDVANLAEGKYFLKLSNNTNVLKSFNILKSN